MVARHRRQPAQPTAAEEPTDDGSENTPSASETFADESLTPSATIVATSDKPFLTTAALVPTTRRRPPPPPPPAKSAAKAVVRTTRALLAATTARAIAVTTSLLPTATALVGGAFDDEEEDDTPAPTPKASPFLIPHAVLTILAFFIIFPLGTAVAKRYRIAHIVMQSLGALLGFIGIGMGKLGWTGTNWREGKIQIVISGKYDLSTRLHKGMGWGIFALVLLQSGVLGLLKLLILRWQKTGWSVHIRWFKQFKKVVVEMHKANGWVILGAAYIESAVGVTSLSGTCLWDGVGGCLGHIIGGWSQFCARVGSYCSHTHFPHSGSALVWYAAFFLLRLLHPTPGQREDGRSEEFYASILITITGVAALISSIIVRDPPFAHSLLFVAGGVLGLTVEASQVFKGRNPVPGLIILTLGFAAAFSTNVDPFSAAENDYAAVIMLQTGYALALGGLFRIIEVAVRKPAAVYAAEKEEEEDEALAEMGGTSGPSAPTTNVLGGMSPTGSAQTIGDIDSDLDDDAHPGFTGDMEPSVSALANNGIGSANGTKPNARPGSIRSTSRLVSQRGSQVPRRRKPIPIVRWENVPAFLSLFFIFIAGTLFIGSSSGAPPRWAWLADVDSIGYAEIYVSAAMICMAWVVLVGAIAQRMRNQLARERLMTREEEDDDDEDEEVAYQNLGGDDDGEDTPPHSPKRGAITDIQMREFLGEDD